MSDTTTAVAVATAQACQAGRAHSWETHIEPSTGREFAFCQRCWITRPIEAVELGGVNAMAIGRVVFWDDERSYGFISRDGEDPDLFVHRSALRDAATLVVGQQVNFEIGPGRRGPEAISVRVITGLPA